MNISEKRLIGAIILLAGLASLLIGLNTGQLAEIQELMASIFEAAVAGAP